MIVTEINIITHEVPVNKYLKGGKQLKIYRYFGNNESRLLDNHRLSQFNRNIYIIQKNDFEDNKDKRARKTGV